MTDVEILGREIKRIREGRGISVRELSEMSGVRDQTIRKLESGVNVLAVAFMKVCYALKVKPVFSELSIKELE
jgi:transcriptional regulator with XRE-family HTH domain